MLLPEICILTVTVTLYSSVIFFVGALCIKYVNWGYQNNDQSVSLIPKQDPVITNFSILASGIENPIPGLQSLLLVYATACSFVAGGPEPQEGGRFGQAQTVMV